MDPIEVIGEDIETGPFHARQLALGATFYEDMGWLWTASFGDVEAEYWALRTHVALWDVSALVKWRFSGPDTLAALDRLTTRRIAELAPGVVRYALVLNEDGAMLDEGTVFVLANDEAWFLGNDQRAPFAEHLARHTGGLDVAIVDVTSAIPNIAVQGPRSYELLAPIVDADLASLSWFRLLPGPSTVGGVPGVLSRTGYSGELGYEFFLTEPDGAERLWDRIVEAGATPIGLDAVELARVEAGLLVQYEDYRPGETDPYDLSLGWVIDLDHDFVGREAATARAAAPRRRLATLVADGSTALAAEAAVEREGVVVGDVRSPFVTPRFGSIALAVVDGSVEDGARVSVEGVEATVRPVPIDDPKKLRPRSDPRSPMTVD